ncbi:MAG: PAS domain-containing protein, partial [Hyphomicrobiales bacterium]|nr:PAS domain-containing protein [Hyphomicrobiales bacterium]
SFAQWHQQVEGTSDPWTPADMAAGRLIGQSVSDIVLQFRAVRTLIAQDQLDQFSSHVRISGQPIVIADAAGRILLANSAFRQLLPDAYHHLNELADLADAFQTSDDVRRKLGDLIKHRRSWRAELLLRDEGNREKPLMLRADPVQPTNDRVLGFVLIFSDVTDRKAAEAARSRFQEGIIRSHRINAVRLDSKADLVYQNLLSSVVENAQLAALEITYGVETGRIAEMLESVRNSTLRTSEVLEHLIWHASRTSGQGKLPN